MMQVDRRGRRPGLTPTVGETNDYRYVIATGSNRPLTRRLYPRAILKAAMTALDHGPVRVQAIAPVLTSRPVGPSDRDYANGAAIVRTALPPFELLDHLQKLERQFGRRRRQRWGARTLDLDIILWSGGMVRTRSLSIPHPAFAQRPFVLGPLRAIAPGWRDPKNGRTINQLLIRLQRPKPVDPTRPSR